MGSPQMHNAMPITGRGPAQSRARPTETDRNYAAGTVRCIGGLCIGRPAVIRTSTKTFRVVRPAAVLATAREP